MVTKCANGVENCTATDPRCTVDMNARLSPAVQTGTLLLSQEKTDATVQQAREVREILTGRTAVDAIGFKGEESNSKDDALMKTASQIQDLVKQLDEKFGLGSNKAVKAAAVTTGVGVTGGLTYWGWSTLTATAAVVAEKASSVGYAAYNMLPAVNTTAIYEGASTALSYVVPTTPSISLAAGIPVGLAVAVVGIGAYKGYQYFTAPRQVQTLEDQTQDTKKA